MASATSRLVGFRKFEGRTHLIRDRRGDVVIALVIDSQNAFQQFQPLFPASDCITRKCRLGGRHGAVQIRRAAQGDFPDGLLGCRVDDREVLGHRGIDPLAVNIELLAGVHDVVALSLIPLVTRGTG